MTGPLIETENLSIETEDLNIQKSNDIIMFGVFFLNIECFIIHELNLRSIEITQ